MAIKVGVALIGHYNIASAHRSTLRYILYLKIKTILAKRMSAATGPTPVGNDDFYGAHLNLIALILQTYPGKHPLYQKHRIPDQILLQYAPKVSGLIRDTHQVASHNYLK